MPKRKKVPSLKELVFGNIAKNIVAHAKQFEISRTQQRTFDLYRIVLLYPDDILQKLTENCEENGRNLSYYLNLCKHFLFTEHTISGFPKNCEYLIHSPIPEEVFSYIASKCKNLRSLDSSFCRYAPHEFWNKMNQFQNLQEVDLEHLGSDIILESIFKFCPHIRKITTYLSPISNSPLLSLCTQNQQRRDFVFCPENGACCTAGKRLEQLHLNSCNATETGIACALQHLPRLKELMNPSAAYNNPAAIKGMIKLQRTTASKGNKPILCELTNLYIRDPLSADDQLVVSTCCPKLKSLCLNLTALNPEMFTRMRLQNLEELHLWGQMTDILPSLEFRQFISVHYERIMSLSFESLETVYDFACVQRVLELCRNVKQLRVKFWTIHEQQYQLREVPSFVEHVEKLDLVSTFPESLKEYFYNILCAAKNVRYLALDQELAALLPHIMVANGFSKLEELYLFNVDIREIRMEDFITSDNSLRKLSIKSNGISFSLDVNDWMDQKLCAERYEMMAITNNYDLEIEH